MVDLFGVDTDLWTAGAAVAQTIIVGAAAVFAFRQVREAQLTREDQSRPLSSLTSTCPGRRSSTW
jgi:hypothetical protein